MYAFGGRMSEAIMVNLHRHREAYDPELSVTAREGDKVVGHALFSPRMVYLDHEQVPMVNLAPVGILPSHQGKGIGGDLIREGLARAKEKGYSACFLLGHPTYYPRFGFVPHAYSHSRILVNLPSSEHISGAVIRPFVAADVKPAMDLWQHQERQVRFSLMPDQELSGWLSVHPAASTWVLEQDGLLNGVVRFLPQGKDRIMFLIARDHESAIQLVRSTGGDTNGISLPLDPENPLTRAWFPDAQAEFYCPAAAMMVSLNSVTVDHYLHTLTAGAMKAGRVLWPVEFEGMD
jgi:predicted N-acetyltransferase YhbS